MFAYVCVRETVCVCSSFEVVKVLNDQDPYTCYI